MEEILRLATSKLSIEGKNKLVALWISKERLDTMKTIDLLLLMDDLHSEVYSENRVQGFSAASMLATKKILDIIYK